MESKKIVFKNVDLDRAMNVINGHRLRVLSRHIDRKFTNNDKFKKGIKEMLGDEPNLVQLGAIIKLAIVNEIDMEFAVLRDDPDDEMIYNLVDGRTRTILSDIYPEFF